MSLKELLEMQDKINNYFNDEVKKLNSLNLNDEIHAIIFKGIQDKRTNEFESLKRSLNR
jgi:hypothetical protein